MFYISGHSSRHSLTKRTSFLFFGVHDAESRSNLLKIKTWWWSRSTGRAASGLTMMSSVEPLVCFNNHDLTSFGSGFHTAFYLKQISHLRVTWPSSQVIWHLSTSFTGSTSVRVLHWLLSDKILFYFKKGTSLCDCVKDNRTDSLKIFSQMEDEIIFGPVLRIICY